MDKFPRSPEHRALLELLRELREKQGVTQVELASRLGETQTFVSKCERGERRLDVIELRAWCLGLGLSLPDFVRALEEKFALHRRKTR